MAWWQQASRGGLGLQALEHVVLRAGGGIDLLEEVELMTLDVAPARFAVEVVQVAVVPVEAAVQTIAGRLSEDIRTPISDLRGLVYHALHL